MIKHFFEKDINRPIETVIKADDRENISDEVVEYVITQEVARKIGGLFSAYNNYAGANGVWISGFFGSGKSHLLKILSYVLENKEFGGYYCGEIFAEKIEGDEMLKADVKASTRIPSKSILFNIDQQAQITSKSDENAVLSVFYKVFFDHLGYYGFQTHVAEFEMWLDKQKKYEEFKNAFSTKFEKPWIDARIDYFDPLVTDAISQSLGQIFNQAPEKYESILDEIEDRQKQSIEDFCNRVMDYIKTKSAGFRLNFFVDEVGQYISDNTKLMLNLQTLSETLATKTKGKSWLFVTSQEDMEKVVGDMTKKQENDFSRIQARFTLKIPLTSANVDEVIEKRLLFKRMEAKSKLLELYKNESAHLDSLISFSDVGVQFKTYADEKDFVRKYPFAPYQFDLFQQCRIALSTHNAFQGKHASVGERSMLGVFQQVVKNIQDKDENNIVSFDMMFEGIHNELKSEALSPINLANRNIDNRFAIRVLKTLFLIKYFRNFKANHRNISVLLIDNIHIDLKEHEKHVEEALKLLENQSYIQRNGEFFEFLTNDEKDIEEEIKNTDIDDSAITEHLKSILFDEIIKENKIKYLENKQDYEFTSKIDGSILGREKELEIEIITENFHDYENESFIQAQSIGSSGIKIVLASNPIFMKDVRTYLKINKFVKQNQSTSNRPEVSRILQEKSQQNGYRRRELITIGNDVLAQSTVYLNGSKLELNGSSDGKTKVINAFQSLVKTVYPNLSMIGNNQFNEDAIKTVIRSKQDDLFGADDKTMSEAESEVLNIIERRKKQSERTSLNELKNQLIKKPYGWYPNAIWVIIAKLYKRGKIELKQDSNLLENDEVLSSILNAHSHNNTLLEPQASFSNSDVNALKRVFGEAFDENCSFREAKDIASAFKDKLKDMYNELNQLLAQKKEYPFLACLDAFADKLGRLVNKDYSYFITGLKDFEDELLDTKEDLLAPIKRFMNGDMVKIYDSVKTLLNGDTSNFDYVDGDEIATLKSLLENPKPYSGNYIREAKIAKDSLSEKVIALIEEEKKLAVETVNSVITDLKSKSEYEKLKPEQQKSIIEVLEEDITKLKNQRYIANIRDIKRIVQDTKKDELLNKMLQYTTTENENTDFIAEKPSTYVSKSTIKPLYNKSELKTEQDVDEYIEAYRKAMKELIKQNKRISL
jgi:predicted transcriptional regulator